MNAADKPVAVTTTKETKEALRCEYADVGENWRFFIGTRFVMLGFFATVTSALGAIVGLTLTQDVKFDKPTLLAIVSLSAFLLTCMIILLECRTLRLFQVCLGRAIQIEKLLGIENGQYQLLKHSERGKRVGFLVVTHTRAILSIYGIALLFWLLLFCYRNQLVTPLFRHKAPVSESSQPFFSRRVTGSNLIKVR